MLRLLVLQFLLMLTACATPVAHTPRVGTDASSAMATGSSIMPAATVPVFAPFRVPEKGDEGLLGTPSIAGRPFVFRVRELPGGVIPPHIHPIDENITVLQGTLYFGIGPRFDPAALHTLPAGSFVFIPHGTPMFGYTPEAVTLQVHGVGAFEQHFVDPLFTLTATADADLGSSGVDPRRFRFHPGDVVRTPRGSGSVREGFAVGSVIEYLIVASDGQLLMAQEPEMQPTKSK